jgi:hypothetical protein
MRGIPNSDQQLRSSTFPLCPACSRAGFLVLRKLIARDQAITNHLRCACNDDDGRTTTEHRSVHVTALRISSGARGPAGLDRARRTYMAYSANAPGSYAVVVCNWHVQSDLDYRGNKCSPCSISKRFQRVKLHTYIIC